MSRAQDAVLRKLREAGYKTVLGGSGHWKIYAPDGRFIATAGASPHGGRRSDRNLQAEIRRAERKRGRG